MQNIAFRVDGGKKIGLGHIMRCLSLAQSFVQNGYKVFFVSKEPEGIEKIISSGFSVVRLPSVLQESEGFCCCDPAHLLIETEQIIKLLPKHDTVLLIDTYRVSKDYFEALKPYVKKLVYIDDTNQVSYPGDILVNGNITAEYLGYKKLYDKQVLLLGPSYNMIRTEFSNLPIRAIRENVREIMITNGGTDVHNLTGKLLSILLQYKQFKNLRINVLVGSGFTNHDDLIRLRQEHDNVFLYANSAPAYSLPEITYSEISPIMLRSDLAISAGGSTLYEFAACGTPVMAYVLADNQEFIVHKMDELGYVKSLGWYNQIDEEQVINNVQNMMSDYQRRKAMSYKGQRLVDGKGTERIVQKIVQDLEKNN